MRKIVIDEEVTMQTVIACGVGSRNHGCGAPLPISKKLLEGQADLIKCEHCNSTNWVVPPKKLAIQVGDITNSVGVAIGGNASVSVLGDVCGGSKTVIIHRR